MRTLFIALFFALFSMPALAQTANPEAEAKRAEAEKTYVAMKVHYDAGMQAIDALQRGQAQLAQTPRDQQAPIQQQIAQAGSTAVTEFDAAKQLIKPDDPNRALILSRLGEVYEIMNKWQEAADMYQQSIAIKPGVTANYNNLGNDLAKLGKFDEARAAYQKYVDLNPTDAALAWRNLGIVLYQANRMEEAIEPLRKATTLDPKNAQAWLLLGIALVNTMEFKTVGDKMTPVIQPGTIEAYQNAINLDPNGSVGAQAKQGLKLLQAMKGKHDYGTAIAATAIIGLFAFEMAKHPDVARGIASSFNPSPPAKIMIFGGLDHQLYLGCLSCSEVAPDSIFNSVGSHGSRVSPESIWNSVQQYGSRVSPYSACNPIATDPPVIVDQEGTAYGRLTLNRVSPNIGAGARFYDWLSTVVCQR